MGDTETETDKETERNEESGEWKMAPRQDGRAGERGVDSSSYLDRTTDGRGMDSSMWSMEGKLRRAGKNGA